MGRRRAPCCSLACCLPRRELAVSTHVRRVRLLCGLQSLRLAALCHRDLGHTQQAAALLQEQVGGEDRAVGGAGGEGGGSSGSVGTGCFHIV